MGRLSGKVAIVTGAAQGIGAAYAEAMLAEGAMVMVADILAPDALVEKLRVGGSPVAGMVADVSDGAACEALARATLDAFGRIDILVNNAAIFAALDRKSFDSIGPAEWNRVMDVNVRGPFLCAQAVVPEMRRHRYGKIVNISSGTVFSGTPGMLHYVTSKGAMVAFTRALARELGEDGICVNAIAPGLTMSEGLVAQRERIAPYTEVALAARSLKREQVPQDLVGTLLYLASSESDFMTGQTLVVDGGYVMH